MMMRITMYMFFVAFLSVNFALAQSEDDFSNQMCDSAIGEREVRHYYDYGNDKEGYVIVDCENPEYVIEGGLDKRSSLDSIQQAIFFHYLTGKKPMVVIYDTDGEMGAYEHRILRARSLIQGAASRNELTDEGRHRTVQAVHGQHGLQALADRYGVRAGLRPGGGSVRGKTQRHEIHHRPRRTFWIGLPA